LPHAFKKPIFCYVTDRHALGADNSIPSLLNRIDMAARAGVDWIQIREKDLPAREMLDLASQTVALATAAHNENATRNTRIIVPRVVVPRIIVNDRLDVALASGSAGVHLSGESAPVTDIVRWCQNGNAPADFLIGVSCHDLKGAFKAANGGASYLFWGPIFDTPSKRAFGPPQGTSKLAEVCEAISIPVIAIGGVNEENCKQCFRAGAHGVAAIRFFQNAQESGALRSTLDRIRGMS